MLLSHLVGRLAPVPPFPAGKWPRAPPCLQWPTAPRCDWTPRLIWCRLQVHQQNMSRASRAFKMHPAATTPQNRNGGVWGWRCLWFYCGPAKTATCTWFPVQDDSYHRTSWSRVWVEWTDGDVKFLKKKLKQETHLGRVGSVSGKACTIYLKRWMNPMTQHRKGPISLIWPEKHKDDSKWKMTSNPDPPPFSPTCWISPVAVGCSPSLLS